MHVRLLHASVVSAAIAVCGSLDLVADDRGADEVPVRLVTPVSSAGHVRRIDLSGITTTSPLTVAPVLPAGCVVTGVAERLSPDPRQARRATMSLTVTAVTDRAGVSHAVDGVVTAVDNARETVDDGTVKGLERLRRVPSAKGTLLMLAAHAHPFLLVTGEAIAIAHHLEEHPGIDFPSGTDVTVRFARPAALSGLDCGTVAAPALPASAELTAAAQQWPLRTEVAKVRPADWLNMAFVADEASISAAFVAAGWMPAVRSSVRADVRTFLAVAEHEGYRQGPVSLLTLSGAAPALVFEKQLNTYARRHHIRVWPHAQGLAGRPVWLAAATHDVGIEVSHTTKHFTHLIDPEIDVERSKVVGDLATTAAWRGVTMIDRPQVPSKSRNAAGDVVRTDGRVAVVYLEASSGEAAATITPAARSGR